MGFLFNLLFIFVLVPLTGLLLLGWLFTKKKIYGKIVLLLFGAVVSLVTLSVTVRFLTSKTSLKKEHFYGSYIIDRSYFPGKQADWQYEHFRFDIKENDSIFFYVTTQEKIWKVYKGTIETKKSYSSERLAITMEQPTHHIMASNPTIYRSAWSFFLVFNSSEFENVFFKKGKWEHLR